MCVILIGKIGKQNHQTAVTQNPHGFSLLTMEQGLVKNPTQEQVKKGVEQFGIWHYRIASSGKVNEENVHPFEICGGDYLLYHNGIIGAGTATMSDTACLAKTLYYSPLRTVRTVLESLSSSNRFCVAKKDNPREFYLFGQWACEAGVLMSHKMYTGARYYSQTPAQKAGWSVKNGYFHQNSYYDEE